MNLIVVAAAARDGRVKFDVAVHVLSFIGSFQFLGFSLGSLLKTEVKMILSIWVKNLIRAHSI